jgi:hypothetical protein
MDNVLFHLSVKSLSAKLFSLHAVADQFGLPKLEGSDSKPVQRPSETSIIMFRSAFGNAQANGSTSQLPH